MENLLLIIGLAFYFKAVFLAIYIYCKYTKLTDWLEEHAEMTWETYKRLGK
jgi:hypothetical protein